MEKIRMLTIPVDNSFYISFRMLAASKNLSIAALGRKVLQRELSESTKQQDKDKNERK